ncbi:hypothetical protein [Massilia sp. BJB1822]|nr:hypothetical protein [Massilia sp. BJB1822]
MRSCLDGREGQWGGGYARHLSIRAQVAVSERYLPALRGLFG